MYDSTPLIGETFSGDPRSDTLAATTSEPEPEQVVGIDHAGREETSSQRRRRLTAERAESQRLRDQTARDLFVAPKPKADAWPAFAGTWRADPRIAALQANRADLVAKGAAADGARVLAEAEYTIEKERAVEAEVQNVLGNLDDKRLQAQRRATAAAEQRVKDATVEDGRFEEAIARIDALIEQTCEAVRVEWAERVRTEARKSAVELWGVMLTASAINDAIAELAEVSRREGLDVRDTELYLQDLALPEQHLWGRGAGALARFGSALIERQLIEDPWA